MITSADIEELLGENYSLKEEATRVAKALWDGFDIVKNDDGFITCDLDSEDSLKIFRERVTALARKGLCRDYIVTKSKSGNYHAVVRIGKIPIPESLKIALQACLGSDWKREFLGVLRLLNNQDTQVSMLFRPQSLEVVEMWKQEDLGSDFD